ncbi:hypothetical protein QFC21_002761 [Naganishia friedmannii]|uniref:Uncharacterized protein n=1 Tax=Naganishia friedmannii TaxID=89922 RepID=A0ACC2VU94_9TREE|nr:hypothetical protein QFC21_002761 [Naganishia friedmannii]
MLDYTRPSSSSQGGRARNSSLSANTPIHHASSSYSALLPPMFDAQPEELVLALYDYSPAPTSTKSYLCLSFEAGDRIRVHSKDASGWWDGELLVGDSVAVKRGWFPSNFVREYEPGLSATEDENEEGPEKRYSSTATDRSSYQSATSRSSSSYASSQKPARESIQFQSSSEIVGPDRTRLSMTSMGRTVSESPTSRNHFRDSLDEQQAQLGETMLPITQALTLVRSAIVGHKYAHIQPSIACVISAIRSLLNVTNCLQRESPLLVEFPILAKMRKAIMANLARLVALARTTANTIQDQLDHQLSVAGENDPNQYYGVAHGGPSEMELSAILEAGQVIFNDVQNFLVALVNCGIPLPQPKEVTSSGTSGSFAAATALGEHFRDDSRGTMGSRTFSERIAASDHALSLEERFQSTAVSEQQQSGRWSESKQQDQGLPRRERMSSAMQATRSMGDMRGSEVNRLNYPASLGGNRLQGSLLGVPLSAAMTTSSSQASDARGKNELSWKYPVGLGSSSTAMERTSSTSSTMSEQFFEMTRSHRESISSASSATSSGVSAANSTGCTSAVITPSVTSTLPYLPNGRINIAAAVHSTQDAFSSTMAALIGHIQVHTVGSHPSSHAHIIDLTREAIDRVKDLLTLMESIMRQFTSASSPLAPNFTVTDPRQQEQLNALDEQRGVLYQATGTLVETSETVASAPYRESPSPADEQNKQALLVAISAALRVARECCRLCKVCAITANEWHTHPAAGNDGPAMENANRYNLTDSANVREAGQRSHARSSSTASSVGNENQRTKFGWETTDDEDEEELIHTLDEDDYTLHAKQLGSRQTRRPSFPSSQTTPVIEKERFLAPSSHPNGTPSSNSNLQRANSFISPTSTPRIPQRRSPSRSVDMNMLGSEITFSKTPRPSLSRQVSETESATTAGHMGSERMETPKARPAAAFHAQNASLDSRLGSSTVMSEKSSSKVASYRGNVALGDMSIWLSAPDHLAKEVTYHSDGSIATATLQVLVEKLTPHDSMVNAEYSETFFATFRFFTTSSDFLEALELRFDTPPPIRMEMTPANITLWNSQKGDPIRLRVLNVLRNWLELHWKVDTDNAALPAMTMFLEERLDKAFPNEVSRLMEMVKGYMSEKDKYQSPSSRRFSRASSHSRFSQGSFSPMIAINMDLLPPTPPLPLIDRRVSNTLKRGIKSIQVTDLNALELARQLTLMESKLFCDIKPEQLLEVGQKKSDSLTAASTVSNQITGWVAESILGEQDLRKRTSLLKYFIKVANRCLDLSNFSTLFAILAGLNSSTILRLKRTWDGLPAKYKQIMDTLRHIIEHTKNHSNYRNRLRSIEPPALPFLGLILTDITFTKEGNPNYKPSPRDPSVKLVNFDKYIKLGRIAMDFQKYQTLYNLVIVNDVQIWLSHVLTEKSSTSVDALYRRSLLLEPRQGAESITSGLDKPSWLIGNTGRI